MSRIVLYQTVRFSISTQISPIQSIVRALSGATAPDYSGHGSDGNEGALHIPESSSIPGSSQSDCLVSYTENSLGGSYLSALVHLVYSTAPNNWANSTSI